MLRIRRGEESKLTSWYFEIDRKLFGMVLGLMGLGLIMAISAGSAEANRLSLPWYNFIARFLCFNVVGIVLMLFISMLNKKWIKILVGGLGLIVGLALLALTLKSGAVNGSSRWIYFYGIQFMPTDVLKPVFIVVAAWFFAKMRELYGDNMFFAKDAWRPNKFCWEIFLIPFFICLYVIYKQPDFGTTVLFVGMLGVLIFVAGLPWKIVVPLFIAALTILGVIGYTTLDHVRSRSGDIFTVTPRTQVWYSLNSIRHGGLFGSGDESYVKDVLPEAANDFVYSAIVEDWGALAGCLLILFMFLIAKKLFQHAAFAKDEFVLYAVTGAGALFVGQICFNMMTALHMFFNKGMTLPFVSYGGGSLLSFCVVFGVVLALVREDTWG
ncbi:MAG: FtsW/RodA/SpoVE family cell cycle protein [Alphaproteobacteria bacterium]|nr:FtsW/RodA/SpoVE family cell cycle protein [Alphaproteobacteria bacterium]